MSNYYVDNHKSRLKPILISDLSQGLQYRNKFNLFKFNRKVVDEYGNLKSLSSCDSGLSMRSDYNNVLNISSFISTHDALVFRVSINRIKYFTTALFHSYYLCCLRRYQDDRN